MKPKRPKQILPATKALTRLCSAAASVGLSKYNLTNVCARIGITPFKIGPGRNSPKYLNTADLAKVRKHLNLPATGEPA